MTVQVWSEAWRCPALAGSPWRIAISHPAGENSGQGPHWRSASAALRASARSRGASRENAGRAAGRKVDFLIGSSTAPEIVAEVVKRVGDKKAMVILDSLHTKDHVLAEMRAYAPLVPVGGYMIVQDSEFNGHPAPQGWGPGPYEAIEAFLADTDDFVVDKDRERLLYTFNPNGFLKRVK